ncbi:tripartite tricarboxylate transporter TctB family protein [Brevibacillus humidisoli]|uniref:tripartite tricarboxylate transporter TctB family protein n=1 Tax=Brevibacillus humidisoli TaxID=2895522 RepID=UPI001E4474A4|nr:tripartite tricarboxylate transporter TctB family protein [Brevibacillus humidisoli]UFJ43102.1 tripartite tricarboxylate transporter TctB family protein [Brevibacillus humidisoli]
MKTANLISALIVMAFAAVVYLVSAQIPEIQVSEIGPAFFPKMLSILLFLLGILLLLSSRREKAMKPEHPAKHAATAMGWMVGYVVLFQWVGFLFSTPLILGVFLYALKVRKWLPLLLTPVGITLFIYFIFEQLLHVPLPSGVLTG